MIRRNAQARYALCALVLAALAASGGVSFALGRDAKAEGFVPILAGGALTLFGLAAASVFALRARIVAKLRIGEGVLFSWRYPDACAAAPDGAIDDGARPGRMALCIAAAVCLAFGAIARLTAAEGGRVAAYVLLGLGLTLAAVAWWPRRRVAPRPSELVAIGSSEGGYVLGRLYAWGRVGARVKTAELTAGRAVVLEVTYSWPGLFGARTTTVSVVVPPGEEATAAAAARALPRRDDEEEVW